MKKILVPFDFSVPASAGFYYAYDMAKAVGGELVVMHMYLPHTDSTIVQDYTGLSQDEIKQRKNEIIGHLKAATQRPIGDSDDSVDITYIVDYGERNEISHYAKLHNADLVIMGTSGSKNQPFKIFGSNTTSVIENAECPVLAVPQEAKFSKNMNIAYATDLTSDSFENILQVADFAAATDSKMHFVHVNRFSDKDHSNDETTFEMDLKEKITNVPVTFTTWSAIKIEDGLDTFCSLNNIDMLVVLKHARSTWDKIFGEKSTTNTMALRNNLPLLAYHD